MTSQFPAWVAQLKADGKHLALPAITRGKAYAFKLTVATDVSADSFSGAVRLAPDAVGDALANFSVSVGTYSGGVTEITFSLSSGETDIVQDADADGLAEAVFDILHTPSGLAAYRAFGGTVYVSGAVA